MAERMSAHCKVTRQAIMKWESGSAESIGLPYLRAMAAIFRCRVADFTDPQEYKLDSSIVQGAKESSAGYGDLHSTPLSVAEQSIISAFRSASPETRRMMLAMASSIAPSPDGKPSYTILPSDELGQDTEPSRIKTPAGKYSP